VAFLLKGMLCDGPTKKDNTCLQTVYYFMVHRTAMDVNSEMRESQMEKEEAMSLRLTGSFPILNRVSVVVCSIGPRLLEDT